MTDSACPSPDVLRDFALGRMSGSRGDSFARHVEDCETCQERLEQLDDSVDELVDQLGQLKTAIKSETNGQERWAQAVLSRVSVSGGSQIIADAGRGLARRLQEGPVHLDRFELRSELGVGSFGYVFLAWDPRLERLVALKVQRAGSFASPEEVERFQREAKSAAQLKHSSIVSLYETRQTEDGV